MAVLHFADEQPTNPHRPEHHTENTVVYTGTHDNDTTVGWGSVRCRTSCAMRWPLRPALRSFPFRTLWGSAARHG